MMTSRDAHSASMMTTVSEIWTGEGLLGFNKGCLLRMTHIGFGSILFFCSYELVKTRMRSKLAAH